MDINTEKTFATKVRKHIPVGFSMFPMSSFKDKEKKHHVYKGEYCIKKFSECLRTHLMHIVNSKKRNLKLLTN